jgi:glucose-1-phosphate thymidylyltransferase
MRGVILAGGNGTRLRPLTLLTNKHLLPIYNKPMVLYPVETLKQMGIKDILLISGGENIGHFADFLGDGSDYGVNLTYRVQKEAGGIAQALALAEDFVGETFVVILGDNIFSPAPRLDTKGFVLKEVSDPERFGVYYEGTIVEKPKDPKSNLAVTGIYHYGKEIFDYIKLLKPSARGELEVTDLNNWCLKQGGYAVYNYDGFWSDAGTFDSLLRSANHIKKLIDNS